MSTIENSEYKEVKMRVLVAGGKGLVGSAVLRKAPADYQIFSPTRSVLPLDKIAPVSNYLKENKIDSVILAAAQVGGISANIRRQKDFLLENLKIQNSVIEASLENKIKNFIFLGSSCIYPALAPQPIHETSLLTGPLEPTNEGYALAKISGVKLCKAIFDEFALNYVSLMPTNLFGIHDNFDKQDSHVPAALMRRFHEAKLNKFESVSVWGTGKPMREFMSSDDLADACWHFLLSCHGGELINIGTGVEISIFNFAKLLAKIVGYSGEIRFDLTKPDGSPRKLLDGSKAKKYGWQSKIDLEVGLRETYKWFASEYEKGEIRGF